MAVGDLPQDGHVDGDVERCLERVVGGLDHEPPGEVIVGEGQGCLAALRLGEGQPRGLRAEGGLDVDLQDVLPGNDVGELEGVGLTPCEVDVHRALEGVRHVLDPREEVAVQVESHVVGGHRCPHEVRQDDPGEIQLRIGVYPDADAVLAGVRKRQRVGPGDPLAGELHLQGVLAVRGERRQDVNLGTLGAELQLRAGIQRPAARRAELHKRIVVHEVVEGVLAVLTSLEVQAQGVGHVFGVPDDVPRDLEAEIPEGDFAVELRAAAQKARCRSDYCKEGVFQGIHGAYRLIRTPSDPLRCHRSVGRDEERVTGDWMPMTMATVRKGKISKSIAGSTP